MRQKYTQALRKEGANMKLEQIFLKVIFMIRFSQFLLEIIHE